MLLNIGVTRGTIKYTNDNNEIVTITESNGIKSIKIYDEKNIPEQGFIGQATSRQVDIELIGIIDVTNLENKEIEVFLGADYNNQTYYINYGKFIVNQAPENDTTNSTIKITAFDYMIKFNKPYIPTVTFPCTMKAMLDDVCNQCDVELGTQNFANMNFMVDSNQFDGKYCRDVLRHIAKSAFSWARIGQDNKLYLDFNVSNIVTETITINDYYQNKYKRANEEYGPINRVVYAESNIDGQEEKVEDTDSIALNGLHELVIYDNYFAYTTAYRQELIQAGTRLFGLAFMPVQKLQMVGLAYLDCTDRIQITEPDNSTIVTIPFNHIIEYNGAVSDNLSSTTNTENETVYKNTNSPMNANSLSEIIVDRALRQIKLIVQNYINLLQSKNGINNIFINNIPNGEHYITNMRIIPNENTQNEKFTLITEDRNTILTENENTILLEDKLFITIIVSESAQNEEFVLITEDGDTIFTENEDTILLENKSLYVFSKTIALGDILRSLTVDDVTYYDELQILQDGTTKIIRRIGVSQSQILYLLDKEQITILDEKTILPSNKNGYYYFIEEINNLKYYAEYIIENEYSNTFSTIVGLQSELQMLEDAINLSVSEKYETIENAETVEKEVKASLSLKVNIEDLISEINASADIIRLIGQRLIIQMQNFALNENGYMTAIAGTIGGFSLDNDSFDATITETFGPFTEQDMTTVIDLIRNENWTQSDLDKYDINGDGTLSVIDVALMIRMRNGSISNTVSGTFELINTGIRKCINFKNSNGDVISSIGLNSLFSQYIRATSELYAKSAEIEGGNIKNVSMDLSNGLLTTPTFTTYIDSNTNIRCLRFFNTANIEGNRVDLNNFGTITASAFVQSSKEEVKKNIIKFKVNALELVKSGDIYEFNYKTEKDTDKKNIGFVIGDDYNTPDEIISKDGKGINTYSVVSILWKAVQEQQKQIEELQKEIKILKGEK